MTDTFTQFYPWKFYPQIKAQSLWHLSAFLFFFLDLIHYQSWKHTVLVSETFFVQEDPSVLETWRKSSWFWLNKSRYVMTWMTEGSWENVTECDKCWCDKDWAASLKEHSTGYKSKVRINFIWICLTWEDSFRERQQLLPLSCLYALTLIHNCYRWCTWVLFLTSIFDILQLRLYLSFLYHTVKRGGMLISNNVWRGDVCLFFLDQMLVLWSDRAQSFKIWQWVESRKGYRRYCMSAQ